MSSRKDGKDKKSYFVRAMAEESFDDQPHTKSRPPQHNASNMSSDQFAMASANLVTTWVDYSLSLGSGSTSGSSLRTEKGTTRSGGYGGRAKTPADGQQRTSKRSKGSLPLTEWSLDLHDTIREYQDPGVHAWLMQAGFGPGGIESRRRVPSLAHSRVAVRSSKPSIASSGCDDAVVVTSPDHMLRDINSAGALFDDAIIDPTIQDVRYLHDRDFEEMDAEEY